MPKAIATRTPAAQQRPSRNGKSKTEITAKPGRRQARTAGKTVAPEPQAITDRPAKIDTPLPSDAHATKQDRMLGLLSRPDGASIAELMAASAWQAHSVRGFLAGTVGKRLGFAVTSDKADGTRRYRIATRRTA